MDSNPQILINFIQFKVHSGIVLCVGYLRKNIQDYFEDGHEFGINIEYAISNKPLATAGQLKTAEEFLHNL